MIIGFEAKRLFQNFSGLGNYSRNTVNLLVRYYPDDQYILFAPKLSNAFTAPEQVKVVSPESRFSKRFRAYWRLFGVCKLLKRNNLDIFHGLSHVIPIGIRNTGIPSVVTIHDLIFLRYPEFYRKLDRKLYYLNTLKSCQRATKILAISHQTKKDLIYFMGIDPGKIEVIYQSCNSIFYQQVTDDEKEYVRRKFNLQEKFILCVGTIEQRKNQLAILQGVVKEKLSIQVVLLGKPTEYKKQIDEFVMESGIRNQMVFLHDTNTSDLQAIYQMAEVMIYPSFFEGFGLPVLEAQASGCPVITSNISSMPEAGGDGALYIDPYNSSEIGVTIRNLLMNSDLRSELIRKGTANAHLFNGEIVTERLMNLYRSLVKEY